MKIYIKYILFIVCFWGQSAFAQSYKTQAISQEIHTIQVNAGGDWQSYPIIDLNSNDFIQISFDRISPNANQRLKYKLIYCSADWTTTRMSDIEYLEGFNDNAINDYMVSMNATVEYTNFSLQIPNEGVRPKLSGNYTVLIYEEDNPANILLTACFSVLDTQAKISANVSSSTDIDVNREHQQVSFTLNCDGMKVQDYFNEVKVFVRQNNRLDNESKFVKPAYIQGSKLIFEHKRDLIFEAGNEYRRFEIVSSKYNGMNVERSVFQNPYYYYYIYQDKVRSGKYYSYDQDQNGRFLIKNTEISEENYDVGSDYFMVNFSLKMEHPISEKIYLNGSFTNNSFSNKYLMSYNAEEEAYTTSMLLKQGVYNYQYLAQKNDKYSPVTIEGNYYESENEYAIYVYHKPIGTWHDQFVGFYLIKTHNK